jgi:HEAT repeat protein
MFLQARSQWLRLAGCAAAALVIAPGGGRLVAATNRQVSVESLIYDLGNPDADRRQTAARDLGVAKYKPATPNLVALAHDPEPAVRRQVELALERMEDIQALPGFIELASDAETDIRSRAVASLVNVHLPRSTGITSALTRFGEMINVVPERDLEIIVEPDVPVDPAVVTTLRARISDTDRGIRRTAVRGLGILRGHAAIPDLLQVVREDRDDELRFEGVRALWKINDPSVAPELVALLNVNNDSVRNELIETLGAMRYHGAVPELTRIVEQATRTDRARILALAALADIADAASAPLFERLKGDANEMIRLYANEGIARTADPGQKTAISAARLVEKSPRVRTAQAFALSRIGEREYLDELVRALEHKPTRDLAREYLLETRVEDRQALFAPRSINATTRAELADVLGRMGDPGALPVLQDLKHDSDADVARAAERATRRLTVASGTQY